MVNILGLGTPRQNRCQSGTDIGACEIQPESIFTANFEGCPSLAP
jgi:hypothetical protein